IICTLRRHRFNSPPWYEALSYEWRPPIDSASCPPRVIILNGVTMPVSENLWQALRHLRLPHKNRTLWVDALCIWQSNPRDRSEQVAMMAHIYSAATRVVSWVGLVMQEV
ncbi:heterokaryon incompatibility, partial [Canariomyces notabilis]